MAGHTPCLKEFSELSCTPPVHQAGFCCLCSHLRWAACSIQALKTRECPPPSLGEEPTSGALSVTRRASLHQRELAPLVRPALSIRNSGPTSFPDSLALGTFPRNLSVYSEGPPTGGVLQILLWAVSHSLAGSGQTSQRAEPMATWLPQRSKQNCLAARPELPLKGFSVYPTLGFGGSHGPSHTP